MYRLWYADQFSNAVYLTKRYTVYPAYIAAIDIPCRLTSFFLGRQKMSTSMLAAIRNTVSMEFCNVKPIGEITAAMPSTKRILKTFEPITFPRAISISFFLAATIDVTSSGRLVPRATIVMPIRLSDIPKLRAISEAPSTTIFPPAAMAIIPPTI